MPPRRDRDRSCTCAARKACNNRPPHWKCQRWFVTNCDSYSRASRRRGLAMMPALFTKMCTGWPEARLLNGHFLSKYFYQRSGCAV